MTMMMSAITPTIAIIQPVLRPDDSVSAAGLTEGDGCTDVGEGAGAADDVDGLGAALELDGDGEGEAAAYANEIAPSTGCPSCETTR